MGSWADFRDCSLCSFENLSMPWDIYGIFTWFSLANSEIGTDAWITHSSHHHRSADWWTPIFRSDVKDPDHLAPPEFNTTLTKQVPSGYTQELHLLHKNGLDGHSERLVIAAGYGSQDVLHIWDVLNTGSSGGIHENTLVRAPRALPLVEMLKVMSSLNTYIRKKSWKRGSPSAHL